MQSNSQYINHFHLLNKCLFYSVLNINKGTMICFGESEKFRFNYPDEENAAVNEGRTECKSTEASHNKPALKPKSCSFLFGIFDKSSRAQAVDSSGSRPEKKAARVRFNIPGEQQAKSNLTLFFFV